MMVISRQSCFLWCFNSRNWMVLVCF